MLLSSVNFVAKTRVGKVKENVEKKNAGKIVNEVIPEINPAFCPQCRKEIEEEISMFKFPDLNGNQKVVEVKDSSGDRVTIATGDDLCLSVEQYFYTIGLREESKSNDTCIFRKKVLDTRQVPNGQVETVVFALDCDQDFYLTASKQKDLELNYHTSVPSVEEPDERLFDVYVTNLGHCLIQPKLCPNAYLHHIDQALSIQRLDLNWRCPEEYFFHFNAVPEPIKHSRDLKQKRCTHVIENTIDKQNCKSSTGNQSCDNSDKNSSNQTVHCARTQADWGLKDRQRIELPTKRQVQKKTGLSNVLFGCFSSKSHAIYVQSP